MGQQELKIRPGSLIIENSHIFKDPKNKHPIKNYGIVLSVDKLLGIEVFWLSENESNFYHKETFNWFLDGTIARFWTIYY